MAQFTVYRNKNAGSKATFPFLVDVQSDLLEDLHARVVETQAARVWRRRCSMSPLEASSIRSNTSSKPFGPP